MDLKTFSLLGLIALAACATESGNAPREYLDETTAATITVVSRPWVFVEAPSAATTATRDFLNVYAIDVNRSGDHRQYLAVLQWWPREGTSTVRQSKTLDLAMGDRTIALNSSADEPRKLGIAQPLDTSAPSGSQWSYFPVDKQLLQDLSIAGVSRATLTSHESSIQYTMWKEARAEVGAFNTTLR